MLALLSFLLQYEAADSRMQVLCSVRKKSDGTAAETESRDCSQTKNGGNDLHFGIETEKIP